MPSISSNIEIGDNSIHFHNESLKISNIARTWIFRFQNIEKKEFEKAQKEYENAKTIYENERLNKRKEKMRNYIITAIILVFLGLTFNDSMGSAGVIVIIAVVICIFLAYRAKNENISYPAAPPEKKPFPNKYGLGIGMNSGYSVVFTAIGTDGVKALSQLQRDIDEADRRKEITIFNMSEHHINVENNEGIINTGDYSDNTIEGSY